MILLLSVFTNYLDTNISIKYAPEIGLSWANVGVEVGFPRGYGKGRVRFRLGLGSEYYRFTKPIFLL